jgi:cysteine synthase A
VPAGSNKAMIHDSICELIGGTPLVRLKRLPDLRGCDADILCKLEFFNPLSSVKDRIALAMVEAAQCQGKIGPNTVLVEPTSGNTGIALAFVCASKSIRLILTMPESMSIERRRILKLFGAELVLTSASRGMVGAVEEAQRIVEVTQDAVMLQQFENPSNPAVHATTTAREIIEATGGRADVFIAGVGTGGTITGCARTFREEMPECRIVAVEPEDSAVLSGQRAGSHKIQGIGAGFVPAILDRESLDEVITIANENAFSTARELAALEGIPAGISSGATVAAALEIGCRPEMAGKTIVVILASAAERYLSTELFSEF